MKLKQPHRACPVCRSCDGVEVLHTQEFVLAAGHILPRRYDVVACGACGFVYADVAVGQSTFDEYYAQMSKYEADYAGVDAPMFADRAAWIRSIAGDADAALVDVGCGNGQLLLRLRDLGFRDLTALDPSEDCIRAIRARGIDSEVGSLLALPRMRRFDVLILSGVLEHLWDLPGSMRAVDSMLNPEGRLVVFVPDASRYADYDDVPFDYFNIEHVNHFDEVSLIDLGLRHGLNVIELKKTEIELAGTRQPVIHCAYRKSASGACDWRRHAAGAVRRYVTQTGRRRKVDAILREVRARAQSVAVWGAGNYASRLLATSELGDCDIVCFVDNDRHKQGTVLAGRPVVAPGEIANLGKDVAILVAASVFHKDIVAQVEALGLENEVIVLDEH